MDSFLSSMTFASGALDCNCDECECGPSTVPPTIRKAVEEHLRKRQLEQPSVFDGAKRLRVNQERTLVKREGGFSLWRLELPVDGGDPIVEYRNSHRVQFVKRLDKASQIYSIGKGIIGSAAEENGRQRVDWKEGSSYFLPCAKGIACGWIHKRAAGDGAGKDSASKQKADGEGDNENSNGKDDSSSKATTNADDVVMYTLKVSPDTLESMKDGAPEDASCWVQKAHELIRQCVAKLQPQNGGTHHDDQRRSDGIALSDDESLAMGLIIELAQ